MDCKWGYNNKINFELPVEVVFDFLIPISKLHLGWVRGLFDQGILENLELILRRHLQPYGNRINYENNKSNDFQPNP